MGGGGKGRLQEAKERKEFRRVGYTRERRRLLLEPSLIRLSWDGSGYGILTHCGLLFSLPRVPTPNHPSPNLLHHTGEVCMSAYLWPVVRAAASSFASAAAPWSFVGWMEGDENEDKR